MNHTLNACHSNEGLADKDEGEACSVNFKAEGGCAVSGSASASVGSWLVNRQPIEHAVAPHFFELSLDDIAGRCTYFGGTNS